MAYETQVRNETVSVSDALSSRRGKLSVNYTFSASAGTLVINDTDYIKPLFVVNATQGGVLYNPTSELTSGSVSGSTLTFNKSTGTMSDSDDIVVYYEATELNSVTIGEISTEITAQGVVQDNQYAEQLAQGVVQDGQATEQLAQGVVQDTQYTEQLAQGVVQDKQKLTQDTLEDLLTQILIQLKILTVHQEKASDEIFTEEDVESL